MPGERLLRYNPPRNRNEKASRRYFRKRGPTYGAPHDCSSFFTSFFFRFTAVFAGANAAREERPIKCPSRRARKSRMFHDGGVFMRGGGGKASAYRDGPVADGGESAAADGRDRRPGDRNVGD